MVTIQVHEDAGAPGEPPTKWWRAVWQPTGLTGAWMRSEVGAMRELFQRIRENPAAMRALVSREEFLVGGEHGTPCVVAGDGSTGGELYPRPAPAPGTPVTEPLSPTQRQQQRTRLPNAAPIYGAPPPRKPK